MPSFRYLAIDPGGQLRRGVMDAPDAMFVIDRLQRDGNIPMRADPAGFRNGLHALLTSDVFARRGLSRDEMALVLREMATMLAAGLEVDRALRFVVDTAPNSRVKRAMEHVRGRVRGGGALHVAMAEPPANFPRLQAGLIRAGEMGGTLPDALARLADMMDRERALARTVTSAMIYPAILFCAMLGSVALLVGYVLPQFAPLFHDSGVKMPTATRLLMQLGDFVGADWAYLIIGFLLAGLAITRLVRVPVVRQTIDVALLRLPILGSLLRENNAARFCRTIGTLLGNGVPLVSALVIVQQTFVNRAVVNAIEGAIAVAKAGGGLSAALADGNVLPARAIHLIRLGEETAQLAPLALKAADIHEDRTRQTVERLVSLLVPLVTILMGGLVASIIGSLLMAMLSLNDLAH
jgi:general secretion pathway protein F